MSNKILKFPVRTDCQHYNPDLKCCTALTELLCTKKHRCGFHQDEIARRLPTIRAKACESLRIKRSENE